MTVAEDDIPGLTNLDAAVVAACINTMRDRLSWGSGTVGHEAFRKKLWEGQDADYTPLLAGWKPPINLVAQRAQAKKICKHHFGSW